MELYEFLLVLTAMIGAVVLVGRWILSPIDRAAKHRKAPVRFSISDFLCLFVAIQVPLAFAYRFIGQEEPGAFWIFTVITWFVAPLIWFTAARVLSKAGVTELKHRFVFLGLVVPLVYYGLIPFLFLTAALSVSMFASDSNLGPHQSWIALSWFLIAFLFFGCGLFTRWMVRQTRRDAATD